MPDSIDALFDHPAPAATATLTATTTPKVGDEIDDLFGGGAVATRAAPLAQRAAAPPMPRPVLGPPSPAPAPVEPPMVEPSAPNGLLEGLGLAPTAEHIGSGVAAGRENLLRGFMGAGRALGLVSPDTVDQQTAEAQRAAEVADATGVGSTVHKAADLLPWFVPGGQAIGAINTAGNRAQDVRDAGGSGLKADAAGLVDGALAVVVPKVVHATLGAVAAKVGAAVASRLGATAGKVAEEAVTGGATGGGLSAGSAGVSAATGDRARAGRELRDIPEQVGVGAGLGAGGAVLGRLAQSLGAAWRRGGQDGSPAPAAPEAVAEPARPPEAAPAPAQAEDTDAALRRVGIDPAEFRAELARANARAAELAQQSAAPHGPQGGGIAEHQITPEDAAAQVAALFREHEAGAGTIQPATHEAPSGQASPTNPAPTEPAVPAPNQEVHHGEEVQGQAAPEALLNDELPAGAAVQVRAGRQFLDGQVLSTAKDGTVAVRLADGRTMKNVPPHRVIPVREEPADVGRGRPGAVGAGDARAGAPHADVAGEAPPAPRGVAPAAALVEPSRAAVPADHGAAAGPAAAAELRSPEPAPTDAPEPAPADAPLIADVPYGGGISQDGKRVFIDPRIPRFIDVGGKPVDAHRFIAIHERAEKPFLDEGMDYAGAHQKATAAERAAVEHAGIDFDAYQRALKPYLERARAEAKPEHVPAELDRKPYVDSGEAHLVGERAPEPAQPPREDPRFLPADQDPALKNQQQVPFETPPAKPKRAAAPTRPVEAAPEPKGIVDFGEKLGGARKDRLTLADLDGMSDSERQTAVTKQAVWKDRDHAAAIAGGQPADVAHLVHQVRGAIAAKPVLARAEATDPAKRDAAIRDYVETVGKLRDRLDAARSVEAVRQAFRDTFPGLFAHGIGPENLRNPAVTESRETANARYRHVATTNALAKVAQGDYAARRRAEKAVAEGWPGAAPWTRRYEIMSNRTRTPEGGERQSFYLRAKAAELRMADRRAGARDQFATRAEAEAEAARRYDALASSGGGTKQPTRPLNPDAQRIGEDRRAGRDVKPEDFARDFGFRGTEFGNWTNQADRQQSLNQAFDGLHDLASLLGVPADALSLEGKLGLAFGARGSGRNAAHYEPGRVVINLTRTKGAGSLAHEWAHAVDNLFGKAGFGGEVDRWLSHADDQRQAAKDVAGKIGVRPEIVDAWAAIHRAIHKGDDGKPTAYYVASRVADKSREDPYWSNEHELFARAFETWANQRLEDAGKASPYLVQGVPSKALEKTGMLAGDDWMRRYPQGAEAERINGAIDQFVGALKVERTDEGKARLYAPERTPGEEPAPVEPAPPAHEPAAVGKQPDAAETPPPRAADEPLQMPDAKDGIESLIRYALDERERTIAELRKRVEKGGGLADEWRHDLEQHEGVDPEALAKDMREFPQHYIRAMTERGGSMSAVGVYRNRVRMPPQQPRVQVAPLPLGKDQAPDLARTLRSLKDDLKKAAPSAPTFDVDRGALPDRAGGQFDPRSGAITTRHHNDLDLVAHEVGHWAAEKHDLLPDKSDTEARAELARFAVHGSPAKGETAQREGMAEFLRAWMVNPDAAEARAPRFAGRMREKLPPRVVEALRSYGNDVRRFEGASALQKMAAGQQRTSAAIAEQKREGRWFTPIWQGVKDFLGVGLGPQRGRPGVVPKKFEATAADKARFHLTDKEAPQLANYLTSLELTGQDAAKMTPSQHWDFLRKSLRGVSSKVRDGVIHNGLPNIDGTVAKDPATGKPMALPWLLEQAPKKSDDLGAFLDKAHAYGSAQRTLELADRFTKKAENEISQFAEAQVKGTGGDRFRMDAAEKAVKAFAAERRAALRAQLARLTAAGGGIRSATEVAREAVAEMESDPQRAPIDEYLRRYRAWSDWNLQYAVDRELLTPGQAETIRQANQFYIDWHRVFADEDGPVNLGEAVQGSSRTMHNPLASLLYTTWQTINRGDRNAVMNTFVAPLRMAPKDANGPALAQLGRKISEEAATEALTKTQGYHADGAGGKARVYHTQRLVQETNADGSPVMGPDGEPMQKIETEHWIFDPATEASLEAMRAESGDDPWNKIVQGLVSFQKLAITSAPAFRFKVPFRDNIDRLMVSETGSSVADTAYGMGKKLLDPITGEEVDLDRLYHQSGAGMAGVFRRSREQAMADVFAHVEDLKKQGVKLMTPGTAWRWWQHMGEASENIARKAEYAAAFRKARAKLGYNQLDASLYAMTHARELLDTSESGHTIARLNRFFLFLNAGTKGLQRMSRPLRRAAAAYQAGDIATGNRIAALIPLRLAGLGGTFAAIRLMHLMFSDDKHQEQLLEQPSWKRDFAITLPDFGLGKIAVPKPYEWGVLGSAFERAADAAWATGRARRAEAAGDAAGAKRWREHASRAGEGWTHSAVTALLPLKFDDILGGGLAPVTEVAFNQSLFTNAPIMPQNEANEKLALRKHAADASLVGRGLSKVLAPVVGDTFGDPRSIDHLLQGYLGGWGTSVTARDFGEVTRRFSGYSGETSPYAERDTRWVLDWATENGVGGRKPFEALRGLAKRARDATGPAQEQALETMREASMNLRRVIESNPDAYAKHVAAAP